MKPIEETHPSLKLKEVIVSFNIESFDNKWKTEDHVMVSLITSDDVQEHTIDKAVLKEAMIKVSKMYGGYTGDDALIRLSKELGLEEK